METKTTISETKELAHKFFDKYNLYKKGWSFEIGNAKKRAGVCYFRKKLIKLSRHYITCEETTKEDIIDTILHEIAHALVGKDKGKPHGQEWKRKAVEVGARPTACTSIDFSPKAKYIVKCKNVDCDMMYKRYRKSKIVKNVEHYQCGKCKSELGVIFNE